MRFLANMGISPRTVEFLRNLGHEAVRLNEVGMQSCSDTEVISFAARRRHVVLTFDLDYPMLLALHRETRTSAIIFRTSNAAHERINSRLAVCLPQAEHALKEGAIVVVEDDRLRVRRFIDL